MNAIRICTLQGRVTQFCRMGQMNLYILATCAVSISNGHKTTCPLDPIYCSEKTNHP